GMPPEIITPNVSCGDGACNGQETYEICPADCPSPPVNADVKISVNPQQAAVNSGSSVTFQIQISSVSNLYGFQFDLNYNQALLEFSQATVGDLLKKNDVSPFCLDPKVTQGTENRITIACTRMGPVGGVDGSGVLESVTFKALGSGTAQPKLSNVKLSDSNVREIKVQIQG
ncbi:MAG: cohesin domain-containing protein, partial [Candidatus Aenigmarchaeota archaeon]|nr:cohesin domain-containing protein [Candidatus Aenigmarchaeota archaeon]